MNPRIEARLRKLEGDASAERMMTHEDRVAEMERNPKTAAEVEADARTSEQKLIAEHGSLEVAAAAARAQAARTGEFLDRLWADWIEDRISLHEAVT